MKHSVSATKISAFLQGIESFGVSREQVLVCAGIDSSLLQNPDNRITAAQTGQILEAAVSLTGREEVGLLSGALLSKGFSNILSYVMMNCRTLGEAAEKYIRYEKLVDGTSITEIRKEGNQVLLTHSVLDHHLSGNRQYSDFKVAGMLSYAMLLSGQKICPKAVYFTYKKPVDVSAYQTLFPCPVFFEKPINALGLDLSSMRLPVLEPNRELLHLFEEKADKDLENRDTTASYTETVKAIIRSGLKELLPTIDEAAGKMSMSVRSLQTRLKEEGTSYTELLKGIRKEMALRYLENKSISTDEIAYVLGFSEASAFHRAFKRWTSATPAEYRNRKAR